MKKGLFVILLLCAASAVRAQTFTVERVIDGSTIRFANGDVARLIGIDTKRVGYEAKEHLRGWLEGKSIRYESDEQKRDNDDGNK